MLPLKQAWALLLKLREYLADVCYFKILSDSLIETTMKQQMTSISDYIIVCLFQNYKNMWNKRTDAKGKCLARWFLQRPVTAKYSLTVRDNVFRCQKKTQKRSKYLSFRHTCNVEAV